MKLRPDGRPFDLRPYLDRRRSSLLRVMTVLAGRYEDDDARQAAAIIGTAEPAVLAALFTHPAYHVWWLDLAVALREGDRDSAHAAIARLPGQLIGAGVRAGQAVPSLRWRFSEVPATVDLPVADAAIGGLTAVGPAALSQQTADTVRLDAADGRSLRWHVPSGSLAGDYAGSAIRSWRAPRLSGVDMTVQARSPWAASFIQFLNTADPPPGQAVGDTRLCPEDEEEAVAAVTGAWALLSAAWPELAHDVATFVRVVVPVRTDYRKAFTNAACQGAVFFSRQTLSSPARMIEQLVHEGGHLQLNLESSITDVHTHSWDDQVRSPFRAGPRPVTGLFHGAVVFARAAAALDRVARHTGDDDYAVKVPELVGLVKEALDTIESAVHLTPTGASLIKETQSVCSELEDAYGYVPSTGNATDMFDDPASPPAGRGAAEAAR